MPLKDLQGLLRPNEAVLQFHAVGDAVVVWLVRSDGLQGKTLALPQEALTAEVEDFRKSIIERKRDVDAKAQALYQKLIAPVAREGVQRLFIVPPGAFNPPPKVDSAIVRKYETLVDQGLDDAELIKALWAEEFEQQPARARLTGHASNGRRVDIEIPMPGPAP